MSRTFLPKDTLVSCICPTHNRVEYLSRAIDCFLAQTYLNKELIVAFLKSDINTSLYINSLSNDLIIPVELNTNKQLSLGEIRNIAIEYCNGAFFCSWDDDDWYHIERLKTQVNCALQSFHPVTVLSNYLLFDSNSGKAYFSEINFWGGSVLCKKTIFNEGIKYPHQNRSEDALFINNLIANSNVYPIISPNLYIYIYHGNNTWGSSHFESLFKNSQVLSEKLSLLIKKIVERNYSVIEGSKLLESSEVLSELNFLYSYKKAILNL